MGIWGCIFLNFEGIIRKKINFKNIYRIFIDIYEGYIINSFKRR